MLLLHQWQTDGKTTAMRRHRFDIDAAPVGGDDALGNGQAEAGAAWFLRNEWLEDPALLVGGDAGSCIRHANQDFAVAAPDLQGEMAAPMHGLDPIAGDVPEDLRQLVSIEGELWNRWVDP